MSEWIAYNDHPEDFDEEMDDACAPYCNYCEREGHTFSSCPARDDESYEVEA